MNLESIYRPIDSDIAQVRRTLEILVKSNQPLKKRDDGILSYFLRRPGKFLRPALVLLTVNTVQKQNGDIDIIDKEKTILLGAVVELIHSASLIHDDILDDAILRRGQESLYRTYNTKMAVLAGDLLFAKAFTLMTENFHKRISLPLSHSVERMCFGEIHEAGRPMNSLSQYLQLIMDKTALLMSACCQSGALFAKGSKKSVRSLSDFGLNFGITYQMIDDFLDEDIDFHFNIDLLEKANEYARKAKQNLNGIPDSSYKYSMLALVDFVLSRSKKALIKTSMKGALA